MTVLTLINLRLVSLRYFGSVKIGYFKKNTS